MENMKVTKVNTNYNLAHTGNIWKLKDSLENKWQ